MSSIADELLLATGWPTTCDGLGLPETAWESSRHELSGRIERARNAECLWCWKSGFDSRARQKTEASHASLEANFERSSLIALSPSMA